MTNEKDIPTLNPSLIEIPTKTVGEQYLEAEARGDYGEDIMDVAKVALTDFDKNVFEAVERGLKEHKGEDFFVVVLSKQHSVMSKGVDRKFFYRRSCPLPTNDQMVFRWDEKSQTVNFEWAIPDDETCRWFYDNKHLVDPADYDMLDSVIKYRDGVYYKRQLLLNKIPFTE